jgi:hypothetical protein
VSDVVHTLTGNGFEFKTTSIAVVRGPARWRDFGPDSAELAHTETPRG